jgi:ribonuclease VapC
MFVDASAIIAILTQEPDGDILAEALEAARSPLTSPVAIYEATLGLRRKWQSTVEEAQDDVHEFLRNARIAVVGIAPEDADVALDAFSRYGKGGGHPAQLNMGDCFAYAVAKSRKTSLLFTGGDFAQTDIPAAAHR